MATPEVPAVRPTSPETPTASKDYVDLPTGKPFRELDVAEILRANVTPVVLLIGSAKCGKTTLLASLHDSFQRSSFGGYLCAGSRTLIGFEERCFDSRLASGGDNPTTQRTRSADGILFYHLKLRNEDLKTPTRHLLIADMPGEIYRDAINSASEMRKQNIIRRADHFVHLIDAGRLASNEFRSATRASAAMLIRRCLEQQMLALDTRVDVLLTKWDLALARCGSEQKAENLLEAERQHIAKQLDGKVGRLRIEPVASRPHFKSQLHLGYGLDGLLRSWAEEPPRKLEPTKSLLPIVDSERIFDRLAFCEVPELFEGQRKCVS